MKKLLLFIVIIVTITSSCKKAAGEGGQATITGKIWVEEWTSSFTVHNPADDHYGADYDVYIIYGNDATYGNRVKSGPTGIYEFKYLRPGSYSIYVYSKDPSPAGKV